eukprot:1557336-Rhodomonas_salina.1
MGGLVWRNLRNEPVSLDWPCCSRRFGVQTSLMPAWALTLGACHLRRQLNTTVSNVSQIRRDLRLVVHQGDLGDAAPAPGQAGRSQRNPTASPAALRSPAREMAGLRVG